MDSNVIKLSGKAELPQPLTIGHNVKVLLEGSITGEMITDNDDGTKTHIFMFKPVIVEAITEKGERIKAKDTRRRSQQMRSLLYRRWMEEQVSEEFESWYDKRMISILQTL